MSKRQVDFTVGDILRLRPKWFMNKQSNPTEAENNLKTLHSILSLDNAGIVHRRFIDVFREFRSASLPGNEFRRMFFEEMKRNTQPKSKRIGLYDFVSRETILDAIKPDKQSYIDRIKTSDRSIRDDKEEIEEIEASINRYLEEMHRKYQGIGIKEIELEALNEQMNLTQPLELWKLQALKEIPDQWTVVNIYKDSFRVVRTKPIIITHVNEASGMASSLSIGFYMLELNWNLYLIKATPLADFIDTRIYHPLS